MMDGLGAGVELEEKNREELEKVLEKAEQEAEAAEESKGGGAKELARDIAIAAVLALAVSFFIRPTIVYETSMQPTIDPHDYLLMSRQAYRTGKVERGDIIIFKSDVENEETGDKKLLIKRVIGVPGDVLTISDGSLYINGSKMEEPYLAGGATNGEVYNVKVGKDEVFVMGDHRTVSLDSRSFGCIKQDKIVGKAICKVWPFDEMRML